MVALLSNRALSSRLKEQQRLFSSRLKIFNFPSTIKIELKASASVFVKNISWQFDVKLLPS